MALQTNAQNRSLYVNGIDDDMQGRSTALDRGALTSSKVLSDPTKLLAATAEQLGQFNGYRDAVENFEVEMGGETARVRRYVRVSQETDFSPYEQQRRYVNHLEEVVSVFKRGNFKLGAALVGAGMFVGLFLTVLALLLLR